MEVLIKEEMREVLEAKTGADMSGYIEKSYPNHLKALMDAGEVSNITGYTFKEGFDPQFIEADIVTKLGEIHILFWYNSGT